MKPPYVIQQQEIKRKLTCWNDTSTLHNYNHPPVWSKEDHTASKCYTVLYLPGRWGRQCQLGFTVTSAMSVWRRVSGGITNCTYRLPCSLLKFPVEVFCLLCVRGKEKKDTMVNLTKSKQLLNCEFYNLC
jgi:hypothetical protein